MAAEPVSVDPLPLTGRGWPRSGRERGMGEPRGVINEVPPHLRAFAKGQRSDMPRAEAMFWQGVRAGRFHGIKFKRQVPIAPYIVDFLCVAERLVIELDGAPHDTPARKAKDAERDRWLTGQGFRVLRFTNEEVLGNCDLVLAAVLAAIECQADPSPTPLRGAPSPAKGEKGSRTEGSL